MEFYERKEKQVQYFVVIYLVYMPVLWILNLIRMDLDQEGDKGSQKFKYEEIHDFTS